MPPLRPGEFCRQLLAALDASEGRRRRRKRDTTPDAIGMAIKRELLESVALANPAPEAFEGWLMAHCQAAGVSSGPLRAMALDIYAEWQLAAASRSFQTWLAQGAPSDDTKPDG
jgi:hypothetical protein